MTKSKDKNTFELGNIAKKSNPEYREYIRRKEEEKEHGFTNREEYSSLENKDTLQD